MTDMPLGVARPRSIRAARDLRAGDKVSINREFVTVKFVSFLPARIDQRALELLTYGRDKEGTVIVETKADDGRTVRHEFDESEVVSIY